MVKRIFICVLVTALIYFLAIATMPYKGQEPFWKGVHWIVMLPVALLAKFLMAVYPERFVNRVFYTNVAAIVCLLTQFATYFFIASLLLRAIPHTERRPSERR